MGKAMSKGQKRSISNSTSTAGQQNTLGKRKKLSQRRIKIWSLVVPLIVAILGSVTSFIVAYRSPQANVEHLMLEADRVAVNELADQIRSLIRVYIKTSESKEKEELEKRLVSLSGKETAIMMKYNPNYRPRWPSQLPIEGRNASPYRLPASTVFLMTLSIILLSSLSSFFLVRWVFRFKYGIV